MSIEGDPPDFDGISRSRRSTVSLSKPPPMAGGFRDLGITPLALQLGLTAEQTNGHWCSRCEGIWFGYTLEAQCPVCGNRQG
jgi:hypothetical protein